MRFQWQKGNQVPKIETVIPHTCPDIDKVIKSINSAQAAIGKGLKSDDRSYFEDAESNLDGLEDILEKLRTANDSLREYAQRFLNLKENIECILSDA